MFYEKMLILSLDNVFFSRANDKSSKTYVAKQFTSVHAVIDL